VALLLFVHILRGTTLTAQHSERVDRPERWNPPRRSKSMGRVASAPRRPHPVLPSPGDQAWILQIFILLCRFEHADHLLLGSGCRRTRGQSSLLACSEHYDKARGCGRLSSGGSGAAVGADDLATEAIFDPSSSTLGGQQTATPRPSLSRQPTPQRHRRASRASLSLGVVALLEAGCQHHGARPWLEEPF
jgi:hypothetical protein